MGTRRSGVSPGRREDKAFRSVSGRAGTKERPGKNLVFESKLRPEKRRSEIILERRSDEDPPILPEGGALVGAMQQGKDEGGAGELVKTGGARRFRNELRSRGR